MATCVIIAAIVCVLITTVAVIVSFATPNWIRFQESTSTLCDCFNCDCGIWMSCNTRASTAGSIDDCRWFFSREYEVEKKLPDWFKAVQGLMASAVATSLMALIIGLFSLCCRCNSCNVHQAAGAFVNLTFLMVAISVAVFGAKGNSDYGITVDADDTNLMVNMFGWSFWLAVGAAGMALISSILYFCIGCNNDKQWDLLRPVSMRREQTMGFTETSFYDKRANNGIY